MQITKQEVEYVAKLARLNLTEEEKETLNKNMEDIIEFANKLNSLDTEGVEPTAMILPMYNVFREDNVEASYNREEILKNAPSAEDGCFKVPKIVE